MHVLFGHWLHSFLDPIWWHRPHISLDHFPGTRWLDPHHSSSPLMLFMDSLHCPVWSYPLCRWSASLVLSILTWQCLSCILTWREILCMFVWRRHPHPILRHTNWSTLWQAHHNALRPVNCLPKWPIPCAITQLLYTGHLYAQCWDPGYKHGVDWRCNKVGVLFRLLCNSYN